MRLECQNITFAYPGSEKPVFRNLSCTLAEPGFHALFGPSGVGKTSFARILSGDIGGYSGQVITEGMDQVVYTYNLERLPGWSAVGKHIDKITPDSHEQRKEELIDIFGIAKCMNRQFSRLSLGQKNRVNLLRYLLQDFDMLILDESMANVDEMTREKIIVHIKEMFPQTFFFYISHNVVEVSKFCKQIIVFRGSGKSPATLEIAGHDIKKGQNPDRKELDRIMLEIMNAT